MRMNAVSLSWFGSICLLHSLGLDGMGLDWDFFFLLFLGWGVVLFGRREG